MQVLDAQLLVTEQDIRALTVRRADREALVSRFTLLKFVSGVLVLVWRFIVDQLLDIRHHFNVTKVWRDVHRLRWLYSFILALRKLMVSSTLPEERCALGGLEELDSVLDLSKLLDKVDYVYLRLKLVSSLLKEPISLRFTPTAEDRLDVFTIRL